MYEKIIFLYHQSGYAPDAKHKTDLNPGHLKGGSFDPDFVLSCRVRTGRSIRGLALPPHCTRAERRKVETIVTDGLASLTGDFKGKHLLKFSYLLHNCKIL